MRVLIVEDMVALAESITDYLSSKDFRMDHACSYDEGLDKIVNFEYDCILLDLMIPGGEGLDLLRRLKEMNREDGVLIITAKDQITDKVEGFNLGADDYLTKPFHLAELSARIDAIVRRKYGINSQVLEQGDVTIDMQQKSVCVCDCLLSLTKSEYDVLLFLIHNRQRVVSKIAIAEHLSGELTFMLNDFNFVYAHIKNLKKKLSEYSDSEYIKTVYGIGYQWQE
ncbi:response regulator transcription factor [Halosquirtibacter xylanolyticus]|uniref:response regulator transcription factor n=1 Tax=Halosquirtibacter xylanolyticus TaxID=3374599 RepID=UPI003748BBB7|nr:response regulator transcription factor [Prolixibacteraceae bacterium]